MGGSGFSAEWYRRKKLNVLKFNSSVFLRNESSGHLWNETHNAFKRRFSRRKIQKPLFRPYLTDTTYDQTSTNI